MKNLTAKKSFKYILVVIVFGFFVFINPGGIFKPFRLFFSTLAYPFQKVSHMTGVKLGNTRDFLFSIGSLKEENKKILLRNMELESENSRLKDVEKENDFLRKQLEVLPKDRYDLLASHVISQSPNGLGNWIEIDKGSGDGVEVGMAVIVNKGVIVGKIEEVWSGRSKVVLVTNPESAINVADSVTGSKGIASGEYGLGIIVDKILQTDAVSVGDGIITSGLGGDIPRGLLIGTVQEVRPSGDHLFQQAVVSSPVNISRLGLMFILRKEK